MSNLPVDRDKSYMYKMWGTTKLITDYDSTKDRTIKEVNFIKHDLKKQTELHEMIRNDEDYDDWEYGTEPSYGKK
jgi:hypothetical protein